VTWKHRDRWCISRRSDPADNDNAIVNNAAGSRFTLAGSVTSSLKTLPGGNADPP
jgi:hypothetical protein